MRAQSRGVGLVRVGCTQSRYLLSRLPILSQGVFVVFSVLLLWLLELSVPTLSCTLDVTVVLI